MAVTMTVRFSSELFRPQRPEEEQVNPGEMRQESSPDRDRLEGLELGQREIRQFVEALDQRTQLLADRQDFRESLIEQKKPDVLPQPQGGNQS